MEKKERNKWLLLLADPVIFFYSCSWLMVLVIAGTLAQRELGLYMAQQKYFASWFFFTGPVPLPGGRITMAIIFINLVVYLLIKSSFKKTPGIFIAHIGALLLLLGGFLTAYFSSEGTMVIQEGDSSQYVSDYHSRELVLINPSQEEDEVTSFSMGWLSAGETLKHETFQGEIKILETYTNCDVVQRTDSDPSFKGFGQRFQARELPDDKSHERNMFGLVMAVSGFGDSIDGKYLLVEYMNEPTFLGAAQCVIRKERTYLPFEIELLDFEKKLHPGTNMPKSYKSVVNLLEDGQSRRVVIQMNEPLRHHGYTFFQSSFIEGRGPDSTVLSAVKNYGRQFPYISSIIMCIGLLIHLIQLVPGLMKRNEEKEG